MSPGGSRDTGNPPGATFAPATSMTCIRVRAALTGMLLTYLSMLHTLLGLLSTINYRERRVKLSVPK